MSRKSQGGMPQHHKTTGCFLPTETRHLGAAARAAGLLVTHPTAAGGGDGLYIDVQERRPTFDIVIVVSNPIAAASSSPGRLHIRGFALSTSFYFRRYRLGGAPTTGTSRAARPARKAFTFRKGFCPK